MKKIFIIMVLLFIAGNVMAAAPTRQVTYTSGTTIRASDVTSNEDEIFGYLQTGVDTIRANGIDAVNELSTSLCSDNQILKKTSGAWACAASSSGAAITLDIGDDGGNDSTDLSEIATSGDTNSIVTEPSADKMLIDMGQNWPSADTATALSANGANCNAGEIPLGVNASGAVEGCYEPTEADISDLGNYVSWSTIEPSFTSSADDLTLDVSAVGGTNFFEIATAGTFFKMTANPGAANDDEMFAFTEVQGTDTNIIFYEGGTGNNRIWNSGSMRLGGNKLSTCSDLTSAVDCDTSATGADLVVQDDGWFGGTLISDDLTASEIVITDASKKLVSAAVATYPSLAELAYVKGVTSAIQTQLNAKEGTLTNSAGLRSALDDETGTGLAVFGTSPTFTTGITITDTFEAVQTGITVINKGFTAYPTVTFPNLVNCDTIDTDANGVLSCGTDGGGGGGDAVTVNSTGADTTANFLDGDIDFTLADGGAGGPDDITATVGCTGCVDDTDAANDLTINSTALITSSIGIDAIGAVDFDIGSGDVTDVTVTTDGGAVVLDGDITQDAGTTLFMGGLLDATGAVDMDYGSGDITDHTFTSDNGTVILDGDITATNIFQAVETGITVINRPFVAKHSIELPSSANPTVDAEGEIALDTTITSYDGLLKYYDGTTEMTIVAMPTADLTTTDNHVVAYASAKAGFNNEAQAGGAGGGITNLTLPVQSAKLTGAFVVFTPPTADACAAGAAIDAGDGNWRLLFDATTDECATWQFVMPDNYSSTPKVDIHYTMNSGTANEVEFEAAIMCVSDGDAADVGTASFSNVAVGSATVPGTVGYQDVISITLTDDSCAASDMVWIVISTDANDATNDDATGDREVIGVEFNYTGS